MKLLFVNCINIEEGVRPSEESTEQLGILYLASSLRRYFSEKELEIKVTYGPFSGSTLEKFKPDIVGLSSVSQNYHIARRYAGICKGYGIPVVIGGVHISAMPHTLTKEMDVGVINEGEETIIELMQVFMEGKNFPKAKLNGIKGIVFHDGDVVRRTPLRERIKNLDTLPMPARELFHHPKRGILTSRGCPYDCEFCFSKPFWGKTVRFFSPEYVIKEMTDIVERFGVTQISIYDDLFTANKSRFKKMVQLIRDAGLHEKVCFGCNLRANEITDEIVELLKSINVRYVFLGIESGNQRVLEYLKKQACTVEENYNAVRILKRHGIMVTGAFIIGSPDETEEEMMDTYRFIRKSKVDICYPVVLTPLPGTPVWELAKKRGLVSDDMDWSILRLEFDEVTTKHPFMSEVVTRKEFLRIYRKFKGLEKRKKFYFGLKHPFLGFEGVKNLIKKRVRYLDRVFFKRHGK